MFTYILTVWVINVLCSRRQAPASHTTQTWMWRLYIKLYCQFHIHLSGTSSSLVYHQPIGPLSSLSTPLPAQSERSFGNIKWLGLIHRPRQEQAIRHKYIHYHKWLTRDTTAGVFIGPRCHHTSHEYSSQVFLLFFLFKSGLLNYYINGIEARTTLKRIEGSTSVTMATATCNRQCCLKQRDILICSK